MKKLFMLFFILFFTQKNYCQIISADVAKPINNVKIVSYDSLSNFLFDNPFGYIGQTLYLRGVNESLRQYGYDGFSNTNPPKISSKINYNKISEKYFDVVEVNKHPLESIYPDLYKDYFIFKLQDKQTKETVYYLYNQKYRYSFPFVVVGYYEKIKQIYIGQFFILRGRNWIDNKTEMFDVINGSAINFSSGTIWKITDIVVEKKYYELSFVLENEKGNKIYYSLSNVDKGNYFGMFLYKSNEYKDKFGELNWNLILSGKVCVGMTKEMCLISWGNPKTTNKTITENKKAEQCVYENNYLYFENDTLTTIQ